VKGGPRFALVVPDLPALAKQFVYEIPEKLRERVDVGTQVRVDVQGRRVAGWVIDILDEAPEGVTLRPIVAVRGIGPPPNVLEIAKWSSWRWAGALTFGLRTASSEKVVSKLPLPQTMNAPSSVPRARGVTSATTTDVFAGGEVVVRVGPSADRLGLILGAADLLATKDASVGSPGVLVLAPTHAQAGGAARRLKRAGYPVALLPGDWAMARAGRCVVVGTMAAAYAPLERLLAAVVLDAHDEAYYAEAAPTWCAWEVVAERARRDGAPLALVSPCPTLDLLSGRRLVVSSRGDERQAWPRVEVVDRNQDDPRTGLFSDRVVRLIRWAVEDPSAGGDESTRPARKVVCVLNRKGRARLLVCASCKAVARCERCSGPLSQQQVAGEPDSDASVSLVCRRCGLSRPHVCAECGSVRLLALRPGVSRVREELEALAGSAVAEVSGSAASRSAGDRDAGNREAGGKSDLDAAKVIVGTEAVLHRVERADAVVFLDFDQELMTPRLRAGEEALALLARASRLVSRSGTAAGRPPGGPVAVQTRIPDHPAISAAVHADPSILEASELEVRATLRLPPLTALARVSGAAADAYGAALSASAALYASTTPGVEVIGPHDGEWRIVAQDHESLCNLLASVPRPAGRLRVEVDPVRA